MGRQTAEIARATGVDPASGGKVARVFGGWLC